MTGTRLFASGLKSFVYVRDVAIEVPPSPPPTSTQVQVPLIGLSQAIPPLLPPPPPPPAPKSFPVHIQVNGALSVDEIEFTLQP